MLCKKKREENASPSASSARAEGERGGGDDGARSGASAELAELKGKFFL